MSPEDSVRGVGFSNRLVLRRDAWVASKRHAGLVAKVESKAVALKRPASEVRFRLWSPFRINDLDALSDLHCAEVK
jgi:hypothetical protein